MQKYKKKLNIQKNLCNFNKFSLLFLWSITDYIFSMHYCYIFGKVKMMKGFKQMEH